MKESDKNKQHRTTHDVMSSRQRCRYKQTVIEVNIYGRFVYARIYDDGDDGDEKHYCHF